VLGKLFNRNKQKDESQAEEVSAQKDVSVSSLLNQTSKELHQLGIAYALTSIMTADQQDVIAMRTASLRLEKLSRQFEMTAELIATRRIDEERE
jgi:hypothetical protein